MAVRKGGVLLSNIGCSLFMTELQMARLSDGHTATIMWFTHSTPPAPPCFRLRSAASGDVER
eukprot:1190566-Prorocentrum_minimum.AAC.2